MDYRAFDTDRSRKAWRSKVRFAAVGILCVANIVCLGLFVGHVREPHPSTLQSMQELSTLGASSLEEDVHHLMTRMEIVEERLNRIDPRNCSLSCQHNGRPDSTCKTCVGCDGGWSGLQCEACALTCQHESVLDASTCLCSCSKDKGWSGPACDVCSLGCQHGGVANEDCTVCTCVAGWTGTVCDTWDPTAPIDQIVAKQNELAEQSQAAYDALMKRPKPPLPGEVGTGVDAARGIRKLPVVKLNYDATDLRTWTNPAGTTFSIPEEAMFEETGGKLVPDKASYVFTSIAEFERVLSSMRSKRQGAGGLFEQPLPLTDVYNAYFNGNGLIVVQQAHAIYELALAYSPDHSRVYELDPLIASALDYLPNEYESDHAKQLYRKFIDLWGTHYTSRAVAGGILEMYVSVDSCMIPAANLDELQRQSLTDMANRLDGSTLPLLPVYEHHRRQFKWRFLGGSGASETADPTQWKNWLSQIENSPVQTRYEVSAISELVHDPTKRAVLQRAIGAYLDEIAQQRQADVNRLLETDKSRFLAPHDITFTHQYVGYNPTSGAVSVAAGGRGTAGTHMWANVESYTTVNDDCERSADGFSVRAWSGGNAGGWVGEGQCSSAQSEASHNWVFRHGGDWSACHVAGGKGWNQCWATITCCISFICRS
eukprot:GILK01003435.1.p1 GENE.GILK01003435.1~~GILK01003435.1.p1  ORF type:complete len:676 (+),score=63.77 GILK01003435.1:64-2028(+)